MSTRQVMQTKPRKRTVDTLAKQIERCKTIIAGQRDKLRDLTSELSDLQADCEEALGDLERATEALSRLL
jgi:uncharacterized coiled-coil protein SlyX